VSGHVPLRDYVDARLADLARYHDTTLRAIQDEIDRRLAVMTHDIEARFGSLTAAADAAASAVDARLERANEFRDAMRDQAAHKTDTGEFRALADRVDKVEQAMDRQRGRMAVYAALSGLILVGIAILTLAVNHIRL
jgi:hypothetical protein